MERAEICWTSRRSVIGCGLVPGVLMMAALVVLAPTARAQTHAPSGGAVDRPTPELPQLDPDAIDALTLDRVALLLSSIHELADRHELEAVTPAVRDVLITVALEPDLLPLQRDRAIAALSQWGDEVVFNVYRELLRAPDTAELTRHRVILLLGATYGDRAVALVAPYLTDSDVQFRLSAAASLGAVDSDSAVAALERALDGESNPVVRERLEAALTRAR